MKFLPSQMEGCYQIFARVGIPLTSITFKGLEETAKYSDGIIIKYKSTDFYFSMRGSPNKNVTINYSPAENTYSSYYSGILIWDEILEKINDWANYLQREILVLDKWERILEETKNLNFNIPNETNKFTAEEYVELKTQLNLLKEKIRTIDLLPKELKIIENKIDHLTELALKLNKVDWKNLFVGSLISIVIQLGVTQEHAQAVWDSVRTVFNTYFIPKSIL